MVVDSLSHIPEGPWQFDASVSECFEDMISRSIPQYEMMRKAVTQIGSQFIEGVEGGLVIDLGCSRGGAIQSMVNRSPDCKYVGVEVSEPMIELARKQFADNPNVEIRQADICHQYPSEVNVSLVLANLTIQFTPIEYRQGIIQNIYNSLKPGGAFIFVEKILGESSRIDNIFVAQYLKFKADSGYSQDSINRKKLSLEGVLVPVTDRWNQDLLRDAGFRDIGCFWRFLNFAGWIAIK